MSSSISSSITELKSSSTSKKSSSKEILFSYESARSESSSDKLELSFPSVSSSSSWSEGSLQDETSDSMILSSLSPSIANSAQLTPSSTFEDCLFLSEAAAAFSCSWYLLSPGLDPSDSLAGFIGSLVLFPRHFPSMELPLVDAFPFEARELASGPLLRTLPWAKVTARSLRKRSALLVFELLAAGSLDCKRKKSIKTSAIVNILPNLTRLWTEVRVNPLCPNISVHILHTVLYTFLMVLTRRICLTIKSLSCC